ncbi:MAG: hypothetical protein HRU69_13110 [Flammeovirgaceae bacterium]|nr:MAG: hypothetical protein HRU69_13110 [Flammeovirgaceae bacterium]
MNFKQPVYLLSIFAFISILVLSACGSGGSGTDKNSAEFDEANKNLKQSIEEVVYGIPSPSEIPYMIQQTGAEFNQSLVNPINNAERYTRRNDKAALNLGVYAADIGYLASYDKTQEAIDYLNSCKNLADILGVIGTFDMEILKRFEANISNKDSLTSLLDQTLKQTERLLKDDSRNRLAALVVTGSFIEGLYISTGLVNSYPKNLLPDDARNLILTPVIQVILNQKKSVTELLKMLSSVEQTEPVAGIVVDLQELEKAYAALNIEEQIRNNRADMVLSDKNLTQISSIVGKIRKGITE